MVTSMDEHTRVDTYPYFSSYFLYGSQYQDKAWGLVDCISFGVMRKAGVTAALTFDQHFVQAGFQALMRA